MKQYLELKTQWGTTERVQLEISQYVHNGGIYIHLVSYEDGFPEPYGDLTVALDGVVPDCYSYVDTNNMPEAERFILEHKLGTFTGLTEQSGRCTYPLYKFDVARLRDLCPDEMLAYEQSIRKLEPKKEGGCIRNLSQLKKAIGAGRCFTIQKHFIKPEYTGQKRKANKVQTNGFYSIVPNEPDNPVTTANGSKGSWVSYGKATDWTFDSGVCTYSPNGRPVWEIVFE